MSNNIDLQNALNAFDPSITQHAVQNNWTSVEQILTQLSKGQIAGLFGISIEKAWELHDHLYAWAIQDPFMDWDEETVVQMMLAGNYRAMEEAKALGPIFLVKPGESWFDQKQTQNAWKELQKKYRNGKAEKTYKGFKVVEANHFTRVEWPTYINEHNTKVGIVKKAQEVILTADALSAVLNQVNEKLGRLEFTYENIPNNFGLNTKIQVSFYSNIMAAGYVPELMQSLEELYPRVPWAEIAGLK